MNITYQGWLWKYIFKLCFHSLRTARLHPELVMTGELAFGEELWEAEECFVKAMATQENTWKIIVYKHNGAENRLLLILRNVFYYLCVLYANTYSCTCNFVMLMTAIKWLLEANTINPQPNCKHFSCPKRWSDQVSWSSKTGYSWWYHCPGQKATGVESPCLLKNTEGRSLVSKICICDPLCHLDYTSSYLHFQQLLEWLFLYWNSHARNTPRDQIQQHMIN